MEAPVTAAPQVGAATPSSSAIDSGGFTGVGPGIPSVAVRRRSEGAVELVNTGAFGLMYKQSPRRYCRRGQVPRFLFDRLRREDHPSRSRL